MHYYLAYQILRVRNQRHFEGSHWKDSNLCPVCGGEMEPWDHLAQHTTKELEHAWTVEVMQG
jgi:formate dehydrogenase maturation protein FdhE